MAAPPAITVYMPAYNVGKYIRQAAESILAQTFRDLEFIIIDDGSTDDTLGLAKQLAARDTRIRLITRPNAGVSATANEAIALSRGEFVARLDADDIALPQRLEKQLTFLRTNPACVAVGSSVLMIDEEGLPLYVMPDIQFGHDKIESAFWRGGWPIHQSATMYRRDALHAVGGYRTDLSLHEDHEMFLRLTERGRLENLPEVLLWYRQRPDSLSYAESASSPKIIAQILSATRRRRGMPEVRQPMATSIEPTARRQKLSRYRMWAWMSLQARHVETARKYARKTVRMAPLSPDSWKLMYCALRGR